MANKYVSIINNGSEAIYLKDSEARTSISGLTTRVGNAETEIQNIKSNLTGAMHYIGRNVPTSGQTPISDGAIAGPWTIAGQTYNTQRFGVVLGGGTTSKYIRNKELDEVTGDTEYYAYSLTDSSYDSPSTLYVRDATITTSTTLYENKNSSIFQPIEYDHDIYSDDIHNLTSGEVQPDFGSVATYQASPTSRELEFVFGPDGWSEFGSTGSLKALAFKDSASGNFKPSGTNSASSVTLSGGSTSKLVTTTIKGVNGTDTVHDTPALTKSSIGSASSWNTGTLPSMTYNEGTETIVFSSGTLPSLTITPTQVGTDLTAGTEKTFATATSNNITVATGEVASSGSGSTVVTSLPTGGTAAAQTFEGTTSTVTVQ